MRAAEARTIESTWQKARDLLDLFSEEDAQTISGTQDMFPYKNSML